MNQADLIRSLQSPAAYDHPVEAVTVLETHISYVLLTGSFAYKIKKALNLAFLDFTTLAARRFFCEEEVRLNRRLAPDLYLDAVAIAGTPEQPAMGGSGPPIEFAVKMRQFPQEALLSDALAGDGVTATAIDELAETVAFFHQRIEAAPIDSRFGTPDAILAVAEQNFDQIRPLDDDPRDREELDAISAWTRREHAALQASWLERRRGGFIRECHGDLHAGNIVHVGGRWIPFDCLEFNESMRWIDVMSDVAFLAMDLEDRRRPELAARVLNRYLEATGDYEGLRVLGFYLAYRAMVRAKVTRFRVAQLPASGPRSAASDEYRGYLGLARRYTERRRPMLLITHGFAGCGKTTLSGALLESTGVIRIRTDVERKRLHGLASEARSHSPLAGGLYRAEETARTYRRARELARVALMAGYVTIVDGTFLKRWQRDLFRGLATALGVGFAILDLTARPATLRERIIARNQHRGDASEATTAVLVHQLANSDPIAPDEQPVTVSYDAEGPLVTPRLFL